MRGVGPTTIPEFACANFSLPPAAPLDVQVLCSERGLRPRATPAFVFDAVLFSVETNLLLTRIVELSSVVDKFIVVESATTFSGNRKPLHFLEHAHCFAAFESKLISFALEALPVSEGTWAAESFMRNSMATAAEQHLPSVSVPILLATSDVDEVPSRDALATAKFCEAPMPSLFEMGSFYYSLKWRFADPWPGTRIQAYPFVSDPQALRHTQGLPIIKGGWHMSYFMTVAQIQKKLASFSHTEYNRWPYSTYDWIADAVDRGVSLFSDEQLRRCECNAAIPRFSVIPQVKSWLCGERA